MSIIIVPLTVVLFKVMISSLMYWEFDRGNCVLSDLNTAMSWLVGWIIQRLGEVVGPVEGNRLKQLVGPLVV